MMTTKSKLIKVLQHPKSHETVTPKYSLSQCSRPRRAKYDENIVFNTDKI